MHPNKVEICGVNTAKLKVLPAAEKKALLERVKAGDMRAREKTHRQESQKLDSAASYSAL